MNKSKNTFGKRTFPRAALATALGLLAAGLPTLSQAQSNSPWLPIPGGGSVGLSYSTQRADTAYIGDKSFRFPASPAAVHNAITALPTALAPLTG